MKQISLFLFVALVAVACQPDLPPLPSEKGSTAGKTTTGTTATTSTTGTTATTTGGKTTATTTATTTASTTGTTGTTTASTTGSASAPDKPKPQPDDIPRRIFQLRELDKVTIAGGRQSIEAFVADDDIKTKEGLMWITEKHLKDNQGMLFVMPNAQIQNFWMQNVPIPLDIIYLSSDGTVVNIVHGKPNDETNLPSTGLALYVLELKGGMAARFGIKPKTKLTIPATVKYRGEQQQGGFSFGG